MVVKFSASKGKKHEASGGGILNFVIIDDRRTALQSSTSLLSFFLCNKEPYFVEVDFFRAITTTINDAPSERNDRLSHMKAQGLGDAFGHQSQL